uniref:Patatin-like phospholipase n=1 Tax=Candidatus Kentrum eta TaxID=2126337 RepID=A0A450UEJ9_9GAMM|nr:MAG: Patatin-like phospholipase [Candidatus Kentron sp. H]VFJ90928.1 MAG: Patatin-like phospholipase [Candidatus Kentron sp. H]VFJ97941.1 MAG: Patatin-like phospholipase [Candidatus Kentron sp. H]
MSNTFEIGLVGAGAISAGAYTGGVIDFMTYALDMWYEVKQTDHDSVPPHDVKISVFSGASAGGITAALAAGYLGSDQPPITNKTDAANNKGKNKLFDSWVERIDIASLLEKRDLPDKNSKVVSLLDSTILSEIANSGLDIKPRKIRRPYVAENFNLLLTVTNLRGVPYEIKFNKEEDYAHHTMALHADYVHFRISDTEPDDQPDCYTLTWADLDTAHPNKEKLKLSALASSAFPLGLEPHTLDHLIPGNGNTDLYSARKWPIPTPDSHDPHKCVSAETIPVNWGVMPPNYHFNYQCVDGGMMNNEPLELARKIFAESEGQNIREDEFADKAVLLIDPFPSGSMFDPEYKDAPDLLGIAIKVFDALKNQVRFKPDELMRATKESVYSRFLIAPSRDGELYPIACGSLGGFGGFLKREFRSHDYFLGRRNAQSFLRNHFVLPENNPLFSDPWWDETKRQEYCACDKDGKPKLVEGGRRLLPIIPLVNEAKAKKCQKPDWPCYKSEELSELVKRVEGRVDTVLSHLVGQYFERNNFLVRFVAKIVAKRKKKDIVEWVKFKITKDLKKMELM